MFPSLTRLEITTDKFSRSIGEHDIAGLPTTLKAFKTSSKIKESSDSWVKLLPRSLERLETTVFWQPPFAAADDFPPHLSYIGELSITSPMLGLSIPPTIEIGHLDLPSWSGLDSYQRMSTLFRLTIIVRAHLTINRLIGSVLCQEPSNLCASLFRSLVSPCLSLTSRIYPRA